MKSDKQRKAMYAAASGKSTVGIPKKVAKEFVKSDPGGKLPRTVARGMAPSIRPDTTQQKAQLQMAMMEAMTRRK